MKENKKKFPIRSWMWIPYIIGWMGGIANIAFWIYQAVGHTIQDYGDGFITPNFHKRVFYYGIFLSIVLLILVGYFFLL